MGEVAWGDDENLVKECTFINHTAIRLLGKMPPVSCEKEYGSIKGAYFFSCRLSWAYPAVYWTDRVCYNKA